jgi:AAA15 family ATPase/GTPase
MQEKIRYTEILFPSEAPFSNYVVNGSKPLSPLSPVNIFIGSNNCGKSRLLRSLFSLNYFKYKTNHYNALSYHDFLMKINPEFQFAFTNISRPVTEVGSISIKYIENKLRDQDPNFIDSKNPIYNVAEYILQTLINIYKTTHKQFEMYTYEICNIGEKYKHEFDALNINTKLGDEKRYYIPVLRGMRPLDVEEQHKNFYGDRTKWDYFKNNDSLTEKMQIFTGLELYQSLKEKLLGEPEERQLVKEFEDFLSVSFFESKSVTLIPKEKSPKVVHIKIGNEPQYPIYELGDGLQNLIICTFNIFTEKERCLFFIEEPDMFMHPSLQRSFLEVLSKFDQHQYFITSHSNHFLDMTIDFANISIFHFSKHEDTQPQFHIRPSSPHDRQILLDLGVRNSSVFITNATIWVEGITDRLYLKAYMKKYIDELKYSDPEKHRELIKLKEDYHYSFVEYQGANLTHWSFDPDEDDDEYKIRAKSICGHAFLIADGDIGSHLKGDRKAVYEKMLGENFYALEVKEIENLIPVEILQKVVKRFKKFQEYGGDINLIKYHEYANLETSIGEYLNKILTLPAETNLFVDKYGTLTSDYKRKFCDYAVESMKDNDSEWSLSPVLKCICEKIFTHIINQNKNS